MEYKSLSPEIWVNKGKKWRSIEHCFYSLGIIKRRPIEPKSIFSLDRFSEGFSKAFSHTISDENLYEMYIEQETCDIPLIENQIFGIQFRLNTETGEEGLMKKLICQIKYPDKQNEGAYITDEINFEHEVNSYEFIFQKLDTDVKMVDGKWIFTIIDEQRKGIFFTENFNVFHST